MSGRGQGRAVRPGRRPSCAGRGRLRAALGCLVVAAGLTGAWPRPALADPTEQAQLAQLERLRREVADQLQLSAYDLLDELVYGWTRSPPFAAPTPVFLASMTVPLGTGTGLEALLENHLAELLLANPASRVTLSLCPACTAVVTRSGPQGTVVSRGYDDPEALAQLGGSGGRHALHVDVSAEGAWLVLRARITAVTPELPVVWSRTLSSATGAPSLLRHPGPLKSAAEARKEYLEALGGRGPLTVPIRFAVRSFQPSGDYGAVPPPPLIWLQTGVELALTQARAWTSSLLVGYAWLPDTYDGLMIQARMSRLISGASRSLTGPDVYLFFGGALITVDGPAVQPLATPDYLALLRSDKEVPDVRATFGTLHLGLEFRVGNRLGGSIFLENIPAYNDEDRLGSYLENDLIEFHSLGTEVTFCF